MTTVTRLLHWSPRLLGILFALFLSIFALDVFGEGYGFGETVLALLIHLVPTFVLILALAIAWRREWIGAALFLGVAVFYLTQAWGKEHWTALAAISGPAALIGGLFLLDWLNRRKHATP